MADTSSSPFLKSGMKILIFSILLAYTLHEIIDLPNSSGLQESNFEKKWTTFMNQSKSDVAHFMNVFVGNITTADGQPMNLTGTHLLFFYSCFHLTMTTYWPLWDPASCLKSDWRHTYMLAEAVFGKGQGLILNTCLSILGAMILYFVGGSLTARWNSIAEIRGLVCEWKWTKFFVVVVLTFFAYTTGWNWNWFVLVMTPNLGFNFLEYLPAIVVSIGAANMSHWAELEIADQWGYLTILRWRRMLIQMSLAFGIVPYLLMEILQEVYNIWRLFP